MLLNTYNHHCNVTLYLVCLRPCLGLVRRTYAVSMLAIFHFQLLLDPSKSYNLVKTGALLFVHALKYLLLFLDDNLVEESQY